MLVRVNQCCQGTSGVSPKVAERLVELLNREVYAWVPEKGSLGASGDLAPSAHVGLLLIGEGDVLVKGERKSGGEAPRAPGIQPLELQAKDALSIPNPTHFMARAASLLLQDGPRLLPTPGLAGGPSHRALPR